MAASEPDKTVKLWMKRIKAADKAREEWESRYEVIRCKNYWAGLQREEEMDNSGDRRAVVNRIMPTLRPRIPSNSTPAIAIPPARAGLFVTQVFNSSKVLDTSPIPARRR